MGKKGTARDWGVHDPCPIPSLTFFLPCARSTMDPPLSQHSTCGFLVVAFRFLYLNRISIPQAQPSPLVAPRDAPLGTAAAMRMNTAPERDKERDQIHR